MGTLICFWLLSPLLHFDFFEAIDLIPIDFIDYFDFFKRRAAAFKKVRKPPAYGKLRSPAAARNTRKAFMPILARSILLMKAFLSILSSNFAERWRSLLYIPKTLRYWLIRLLRHFTGMMRAISICFFFQPPKAAWPAQLAR